jgi:arylsulfatase A-like enzyme
MRKDPASIPPELHQTTWCTDRAIDFVRGAAERPDTPWLFSVNVFDPHPPYDPPQSYLDRYDIDSMPGPHFRETDLEQQRRLTEVDFQDGARRPEEFDGRRIQAAYWAMVDLIDENLGRLLEALEETGQLEDTVVIFTSDHGEMLGDHGLTRKGCRFYEALVRVPLILRWPACFRSGLRSDALVELMDLAPTVLELGGLEPPEHMQARSLLPILTGRAEPDRHRDLVRCQYYSALPPREVVPDWGFEGSRATMVRDERYKLTAYHAHDLGELYDLQEDPWEFQNLWDDPAHQEQRHRLLKCCLDEVALSIDLGPPQVADY